MRPLVPLDADCLFAAIDSDAPKHLHLRWPGNPGRLPMIRRLATAEWCGVLGAPTVSHFEQIKSSLQTDAAHWSFTPMIGELMDDLEQQALRTPSLSAALTASMYRLDWSLGLRHQSIVMSRLWANEPYLSFVHHLIANADSFASIYNTALGEFREAHGIDNPGRPMPDLQSPKAVARFRSGSTISAATFAIRATVHGRPGQWRLEVEGDAFNISADLDLATSAGGLQQFSRRHNRRLATL